MRALAIKQRLPSVTCTCTFSFKIFCAIKTIENQLTATFTESLLKSKLKRLQINLKILLWGNSYVCLARWGSLETTSSLFFLSPLSETCETRTRHARDGTRETGLPSLINLKKKRDISQSSFPVLLPAPWITSLRNQVFVWAMALFSPL